MNKTYHVYCNGFEATKHTVAEVQAFIDELRAVDCNIGCRVQVTPSYAPGMYRTSDMRSGILTKAGDGIVVKAVA